MAEEAKEVKARIESLRDPSIKGQQNDDRIDQLILKLLTHDQSTFPFIEIEPCINQATLQV